MKITKHRMYFFGIAFYLIYLIIVVFVFFGQNERAPGSLFDLRDFFRYLGVLSISIGSAVLVLYLVMVRLFYHNRRAFRRSVLSLAGVSLLLTSVYLVNEKINDQKRELQKIDTSSAQTLNLGESRDIQPNIKNNQISVFSVEVPTNGSLKIEIVSGRELEIKNIKSIDVLDSKKGYVERNQKPPISLERVKSTITYYVVVTRYDPLIGFSIRATVY